MKSRRLSVLIAAGAIAVLTAGMLLPYPWLAKESIFEFTARVQENCDLEN